MYIYLGTMNAIVMQALFYSQFQVYFLLLALHVLIKSASVACENIRFSSLFVEERRETDVFAGYGERDLREKKGGQPVDFVLMLPIHDTRFWHHDLIVQIFYC